MSRYTWLIRFVLVLALFAGGVPSFGQKAKNSGDIPLGSVWFRGDSTRLSKDAKDSLDILIKKIKANPAMQVEAVEFNKDLSDRCGARNWDRSVAVMSYLWIHGISEDRLIFTSRLDSGEKNKVELFLK